MPHAAAYGHGESNDHMTDDVTWPWNVKLMSPYA